MSGCCTASTSPSARPSGWRGWSTSCWTSSRIRIGRLALQLEDFDLAALVREVVTRHTEVATRAGCTLTLEAPHPVAGRWDRLRMEQVVTNLLSNACKYGAAKPVVVAIEAHNGRARISVSDRGIGIAPEDVGRIFGRFERAASGPHYGGLGLGLYITRQIVEAHGGSISVASRPGEGGDLRHRAAAHRTHRDRRPGDGPAMMVSPGRRSTGWPARRGWRRRPPA